jgi:DNA (cytosine-5)-methyltransferase 1
MINKEEYSLFKNIDLIETAADKKVICQIISDFIRVVKSCYPKESLIQVKEISDYHIVYLIKIGVIDRVEQLSKLKVILKDKFNELLSIIEILAVQNNDDIDNNIKKFMDTFRKAEVERYLLDNSSPTIVDLFCGSGGMSLGFSKEGYKILLANDIEEVCINTYSFNHMEMPRNRAIKGDIRDIVNNVKDQVSEEVNVIIGGPPCQGFSMANRQRIINDPRNVLYKYYVEAVHKFHPKIFVMENVKGMLAVAEQVKEDFSDLYDVDYKIFNAKNFSVPQNRERLIYIGIRKDYSITINKTASDIIKEIINSTSRLKEFVLADALYGLKELHALTIKNATELDTEESGAVIEYNREQLTNEYIDLINSNRKTNLVFNHKARFNNDRDIEIYRRMLPGDKSDSDRIADIMPYKHRSHMFKDKYYKLKMNEICKTITAHMKFDCNMYIHPNQARGLTPREAARVQSYPDDYLFLGAYTKTFMQIGNSVPVLMARQIAKVIKGYL